jgi:hypothetical protein
MALKKSNKNTNAHVRTFNEFLEAKEAFENSDNPEDLRLEALYYIINHKEIYYVLRILADRFKENNLKEHVYIDFAFANFENRPKREEDFKMMFEMLKSDNAYIRNAAIKFLQDYGLEAKPFLEQLMNDEDKDIRIFAINILGDVKYEDSIDMLRYFILKEKDINALMTAVDYLGEIGEESDIAVLQSLKEEYKDIDYVVFGIDLAIDRIKGTSKK